MDEISPALMQRLGRASLAVLLCLMIALLISSLCPKARILGRETAIRCSALCTLLLWGWCLQKLYFGWGVMLCLVGIALGGIGVIPVALVCFIGDHQWADIGILVGLAALSYMGFQLTRRLSDKQIDESKERSNP